MRLFAWVVMLVWLVAEAATPAPAAAPASAATLPVYRLDIGVDPAARRLIGLAVVTLPAAASPRTTVRFALRNDMGTPEVTLAAPAPQAGSLAIARIGTPGQFDTQWEIRLPSPWPAGQPLPLRIRFSGGNTTTLNFHVGPEVVFTGGGTSAWYPQFDGARATGELVLHVPAALSVVATASRQSDTIDGGTRTVRFVTRWPTHFGFVAGSYVVRRAAGPRQAALYLLRDRPFADRLIETARGALDVLEREFGPYPFDEFSIVEVPSGPGQEAGFLGAAFDGYMLMRSDLMDARQADPHFFGHEIGHQWWGVSIERTGAGGEYMMDEALANFAGLRVVEALRGPAEARRYRAGDGHYEGARQAARLIAAGHDRPLANLPTAPEYYALSDSKGYLFYDMLARLIAPQRLRAVFRRSTAAHAHSTMTWDQFLRALREGAGRDIDGFLAQWLDRAGVPVLDLSWAQRGGELTISVTQSTPGYRLQMPVRIAYADGTAELIQLSLAGGPGEARRGTAKPVLSVDLDPDRTVLFVTPAEMREAQALRFVTRGVLLWDNNRSEEAEQILREGLATPSDVPTAAEFLSRVYLGWIAQEAGRTAEALALYETAVALPVRDAALLPRAYLNLAQVHQALDHRVPMRAAARAAIMAERAAGAATRISTRAEALLQGQ